MKKIIALNLLMLACYSANANNEYAEYDNIDSIAIIRKVNFSTGKISTMIAENTGKTLSDDIIQKTKEIALQINPKIPTKNDIFRSLNRSTNLLEAYNFVLIMPTNNSPIPPKGVLNIILRDKAPDENVLGVAQYSDDLHQTQALVETYAIAVADRLKNELGIPQTDIIFGTME